MNESVDKRISLDSILAYVPPTLVVVMPEPHSDIVQQAMMAHAISSQERQRGISIMSRHPSLGMAMMSNIISENAQKLFSDNTLEGRRIIEKHIKEPELATNEKEAVYRKSPNRNSKPHSVEEEKKKAKRQRQARRQSRKKR